jgi:hypothetical protein
MGEYYGDSGTWKLISKQLSQMGQAVLKKRLRGGRKRDRKRKPSSWTRTTLIGVCNHWLRSTNLNAQKGARRRRRSSSKGRKSKQGRG